MAAKLKQGSGNVFLDVGIPPAEADNLMLRAQLMSSVRDTARGASQREACKRFGITQPRLNDVLRGRIDKFSLDVLVNMLRHAGLRVVLRVVLRGYCGGTAGVLHQCRERRTSDPTSRISATRPSPMIVAPEMSSTLR